MSEEEMTNTLETAVLAGGYRKIHFWVCAHKIVYENSEDGKITRGNSCMEVYMENKKHLTVFIIAGLMELLRSSSEANSAHMVLVHKQALETAGYSANYNLLFSVRNKLVLKLGFVNY